MEPKKNTSLAIREGFVLPRIISEDRRKARGAFIHFFTASIKNSNTRRAYARAVRDFFAYIEERRSGTTLHEMEPFMIAAFIKQLFSSARSKQQYISALRMLFGFFVEKGILPGNPAFNMKPPRSAHGKERREFSPRPRCEHFLNPLTRARLSVCATGRSSDSCSIPLPA